MTEHSIKAGSAREATRDDMRPSASYQDVRINEAPPTRGVSVTHLASLRGFSLREIDDMIRKRPSQSNPPSPRPQRPSNEEMVEEMAEATLVAAAAAAAVVSAQTRTALLAVVVAAWAWSAAS